MALTDFFRINMPYGIRKNENNEWSAFNRDRHPLGWYTFEHVDCDQYPIYTAYEGLTDKKLLKLADSTGKAEYDDFGKIIVVFLYQDHTNPIDFPRYWNEYFEKIKTLSKFKVAPQYK